MIQKSEINFYSYARKSEFFNTQRFFHLKSKIQKLPKIDFLYSGFFSSCEISLLWITWSRVMYKKKLNFSKFRDFSLTTYQNKKFQNRRKLFFKLSSLVSSSEIFLHWSNFGAELRSKSGFFKIQGFFTLKIENSKIIENFFLIFKFHRFMWKFFTVE